MQSVPISPSQSPNKLLLQVEALEERILLASFQLVMAGQTNQEIVDVLIDDQVVATFSNIGGNARTGEFQTYSFDTDLNNRNYNLKIQFVNDSNAGGVDRNVRIQSVSIDGTNYEADAPSVFSTGTWRAPDGCSPGFKQSQWLTCDGYLEFNLAQATTIDAVASASTIETRWLTETIDDFENPVIIVSPPTNNDDSPGVVQVKNVSGNAFDLRFKEWNYLDNSHGEEGVDWLALETGRYQSADGSSWEVGTFDISGNAVWQRNRFQQSFDRAPNLFLTIQTQNGAPVIVRARNVFRGAFDAALFEEQFSSQTGHGVETIGYLAVDPAAESGIVSFRGTEIPYLFEQKDVNHNAIRVVRSGVKLQEEQSFDTEIRHSFERVNGLGFGNRLFAQIVEANGIDPVTLRRSDAAIPTELPIDFVLEEIVSDSSTDTLVGVEADNEGRQYLVDQRGIVWLVDNGRRQEIPFLDIREEVSNVNFGSGQLTGFALDPNYSNNGYVYALYTTTVNSESFGRLTRFTRSNIDPRQVSADSAKHLIGQNKALGLIASSFHSVGDIEFGFDGSLLFSWGDSASNDDFDPRHFNSQNFNIAAGKIFRVDPKTGKGLPSNPFFDGNGDRTASKIWAYGIRNGFRFTVQSGTGSSRLSDANPGRILLTDVGRNRFEELNVIDGGENLGWPYFEGNVAFRSGGSVEVVGPAVTFAHPDSRSVTGGVFYEGSNWPGQYQGRYFAADFVEGWIRSFSLDADGTVRQFAFATGIRGIVDMKFDPLTGDVLLVGRGQGSIFGDQGLSGLYRLRFTG